MTSEPSFLEEMVNTGHSNFKGGPLYKLIFDKIKRKIEDFENLNLKKEDKQYQDALKYFNEAIEAFQKEDYKTTIADLKGISIYFESKNIDYAQSLKDLAIEIGEFCIK